VVDSNRLEYELNYSQFCMCAWMCMYEYVDGLDSGSSSGQ
jgi:hypothetical protein